MVVTVDKSGAGDRHGQQGDDDPGRPTAACDLRQSGRPEQLGRTLYAKTDASGEASVGNPGVDGKGTLSQYFLEMSNVNVITRWVKMITGQRAYEINSKSIQTADTMLGHCQQPEEVGN